MEQCAICDVRLRSSAQLVHRPQDERRSAAGRNSTETSPPCPAPPRPAQRTSSMVPPVHRRYTARFKRAWQAFERKLTGSVANTDTADQDKPRHAHPPWTGLVCPMRCTRAMACRSLCGFQSAGGRQQGHGRLASEDLKSPQMPAAAPARRHYSWAEPDSRHVHTASPHGCMCQSAAPAGAAPAPLSTPTRVVEDAGVCGLQVHAQPARPRVEQVNEGVGAGAVEQLQTHQGSGVRRAGSRLLQHSMGPSG